MNKFVFLGIVLVIPLGLPTSAHAQSATECRQLECSGRHIECRSSNPVNKLKCEGDKEKWKKGCEVKKAACIAAGFVVGQ